MSDRVFVLLRSSGNPEEVVQILRRRPGVVIADLLEGSPDIMMVVEASGRSRLVELTVQALVSMETEDVYLLPTRATTTTRTS